MERLQRSPWIASQTPSPSTYCLQSAGQLNSSSVTPRSQKLSPQCAVEHLLKQMTDGSLQSPGQPISVSVESHTKSPHTPVQSAGQLTAFSPLATLQT